MLSRERERHRVATVQARRPSAASASAAAIAVRWRSWLGSWSLARGRKKWMGCKLGSGLNSKSSPGCGTGDA